MTPAAFETALRAVPLLSCGHCYACLHGTGRCADLRPDYPTLAQIAWEMGEKEIAHDRKKWHEYEDNYILPLFRYAKEDGWSLQDLVAEARGNCVVMYREHEKTERDALRGEVERLRAALAFVRGNYQPACPFCVEHRDTASAALVPKDGAR